MKRILLAILLLGAALRAQATDWTDIWFNILEQGYGYNLVQSDNFIYVTFYVYDQNGQPVWYGAGLYWDANTGTYTGTVYKAVGTFFGAPWDPSKWSATAVGSATFAPSTTNNYSGTFSYTITGVGSATQSLVRQTLTAIALGGDYVGGQGGAYSGCTDPANSYPYSDYFDLTVTHNADSTASFDFTYKFGLGCTIAGALVQHGQYYEMPDASYTCTDGLDTTASMSEIKATSLGIEGRLHAPNVGGNCAEDATFGATLLQ